MPSFEHIKPFTSGARTIYSVMPRFLTWPPPMHRLICTRCLAYFLASCELHLIPSSTGSLVPSLLVSPSPRRPLWLRPFALVLHLQQRKPSRILHLQYLSQSECLSTQRCQPLITSASTTHHFKCRETHTHNTTRTKPQIIRSTTHHIQTKAHLNLISQVRSARTR